MLLSRSKTFLIVCKLDDGDTAKYVQAKIYDKSGTLLDSVSVPHNALGNYQTLYTYSGSEAVLIMDCKVYSDAGFTTPDTTHSWPTETVVFDDANTTTPPTVEDIRIELDANSIMFSLIVKLLRNAHEITDDDGGTLYIYDGNTKSDPVLEKIELYGSDDNRTTDNFTYMKRVTA